MPRLAASLKASADKIVGLRSSKRGIYPEFIEGLRTSRDYFNPVRADASINSAVNAALRTSRDYFNPVRADASSGSAVNAALRTSRDYFNPVRADASINSAVNAALRTSRDYFNPVRAELVEAYELIKKIVRMLRQASARTERVSEPFDKLRINSAFTVAESDEALT